MVIIDRDDAGEKHARTVAASLHAAGVPVTALELPTGKDAADWIAGGGTNDALHELVKAAPTWEPTARKGLATEVPAGGTEEIEMLRAAAATALNHSRPLDLFEESCRAMRLGGNLALAKTIYLAATTRVLGRGRKLQAHTFVLGVPSSGKSYEMEAALDHLPATPS